MNTLQLTTWLKGQTEKLDQIIASAANEFHTMHKSKSNFGFDLAQCQAESFNLIDNKDLCYDRMNTALCYSLWYHGRRVNTFLTYFAETVLTNKEPFVTVFDLGAGTGAVQWAIGLIYHKLKSEGLTPPIYKIINVDTSPFMLSYGRDFLWKHFLKEYPSCNDLTVHAEYEVNSWSNSNNVTVTNPWITASYLFDVSDTYSGDSHHRDYLEAVKNGFRELVKVFEPSKILLLTSDQPVKRQLLLQVQNEFSQHGYSISTKNAPAPLLTGLLIKTNELKSQLNELYSADMSKLPPRFAGSLLRKTDWSEYRFAATVLSRQQGSLAIPIERKEKATLKLYNEPIRVRREITLNEDQKKAAEYQERPTIITGPAGCGKSVVLTERLKNLVQEKAFDPTLHILVTTFNKQLLKYLGTWVEDLLTDVGQGKFKREGNFFTFSGSHIPNITLMWFDILPTRLGIGLSKIEIGLKPYHSGVMQQAINDLKKERGITTTKYDDVLNTDFLLDEYQRIVYGLEISKIEDYLEVDRIGRGKRLKKGAGGKRELIADVIYKKYLTSVKFDSFILKRHRFLQQLKRGKVRIKYTHIFVDEFQDCTKADYEIFNYLLLNANNFVLAGDVAQAIQLGTSLSSDHSKKIMRIRSREEMGNFRTFELKGSYRVPFRIAEAIQRINYSDEQDDDEIKLKNDLVPYKGAPPGARPIVVFGATYDEMLEKIANVYNTFSQYGLDRLTALETDWGVYNYMRRVKIPCETDTVLRLKGLEKTCVLWNTRIDISYKEEVKEFVYTILSRTAGVLIIALCPDTLPKYSPIFDKIRRDRIIFWDHQSQENYERLAGSTYVETNLGEDE